DQGRSLAVPALRAAAARGGRIFLVTDGELEDGGAVPEALLAGVVPVVLPRDTVPDAALREAALPRTIRAEDSLEIRVEIVTRGPLPDTAALLEVSAGGRRLARRTVALPPSPGAGYRAIVVPPRSLAPGTHVLDVRLTTGGDREPRNDRRRRPVTVGVVPDVVLLASPPDWESRFLARELADVTGSPVRAFSEIAPGRWVDMRTGGQVAAPQVAQAARGAALVVRVGVVRADGASGSRARATWNWPTGDDALVGDWYPSAPVPASPLTGRLGAVEWDSVPPVAAMIPLAPPPDGWVALSARLVRRGAERPLLVGHDSAGRRTLTTAAEGLWRWALRGGAPREAYRAMLAGGVDWLLATGRGGADGAITAAEVVPRGLPVTFRRPGAPGPAGPVAVTLTGDDTARTDTLAFDARGEARLLLPPGVYRWRVDLGPDARGTVVVEEYSDEFVARPVAVPAGVEPGEGRRRVGARETWWMFALALAALIGEWAWRTRRGLP
ncbi:MAG TPA: hypothetical protein VFH97_10795, partial [Gemmatimonadales bacterium]|nr:hypothetical protein [Gemmatimonadales bacterium]